MSLNPHINALKAELEQLGFQTLQIESELLIARRRSFYWECMFTFVNYTVFVKTVKTLSAQIIEADRSIFLSQSKQLNPANLPRGFQSGNAVLVAYIADHVDAEAQQICNHDTKRGFAQFYVPAAFDLSCEGIFLIKRTPLLGGIYYDKFRYILSRVLIPQGRPNREPRSTLAIALMAMVMAMLLLQLLIFLHFVLKFR